MQARASADTARVSQTRYGIIVILLVTASRAPVLQIAGKDVTMNTMPITKFTNIWIKLVIICISLRDSCVLGPAQKAQDQGLIYL